MIERRHALSLKTVKTQLPRRESERRCHPLARHCDILMSIETRISMLNMTYSKFIENGICCFIPGKVIDEISRVLRIVETSTSPPRAHEVLQELRDISSMAIEHFDDKISPAFKKRLQAAATPHAQRPRHNIGTPMAVDHELLNLKRRTLMNAKLSVYLASQYVKMFRKCTDGRAISRHHPWIRVAGCVTNTYINSRKRSALLNRNSRSRHTFSPREREGRKRRILLLLLRRAGGLLSLRLTNFRSAELKRRVEECDIKYSELTHTNQAVGGKSIVASTSRGEELPAGGQPLRHFASQIKLDLSVLPIGTSKRNAGKLLPNMKPRKPVIKLPSISEDDNTNELPDKIQKVDEKTEKKLIRDESKPSTSKDKKSETSKIKRTCHSEESKLKKITKELQLLSDSSLPVPQIRVGKRPAVNSSAVDAAVAPAGCTPTKKQKRDTVNGVINDQIV
ncbi:F-box only protein 28 [Eumeta japonica]|uniref:F-box only protein 28 n=1 Tax=Eumeta variegata TaxID=151549 RepID=A0A4C1WW27_EUMVA|nr:F-box only protein 28 [Eumeta japonica]